MVLSPPVWHLFFSPCISPINFIMEKKKKGGTGRGSGSSTKSSRDDQRKESSSKTSAASDRAQKGNDETVRRGTGYPRTADTDNNRSGGENAGEE